MVQQHKGWTSCKFSTCKVEKNKISHWQRRFCTFNKCKRRIFFCRNAEGYLVVMKNDNSIPVWKHNMFNGYGSIDFMRFFKNHRFVVGTSMNTYVVNPLKKKIEDEIPIKSITDIDFDN